RFKKAAREIQSLTAAFSPAVTLDRKLHLYALFKQATEGDCTSSKPAFFYAVARTRWEAWNGLRGQTKEQAQVRYIDVTLEV
ncbi:acyl-CoA-binding protein, partial [Dimargaris cristalligena]